MGGGERRFNYLLLFFAFIIFISFIYALQFTTNSQSTFDEGTYQKTFYNTSGFVQLNATNVTGNYTSKIFDAGALASWNNISWTQGGYYQKELPSNQVTETEIGGANMTGNVLLIHFNNDSAYGENSTLAYDFSGNGRNGTVVNATFTTNGKLGAGAMFFDGDNDYVTIGTGSDFSNVCANITAADGVQGCTFSAWVYTIGSIDSQIIARSSNGGNDQFFKLEIDADLNRVIFRIHENGNDTRCIVYGLSLIHI